MNTLGLLLTLLSTPLLSSAQQVDLHEGALIESAEVQGLSLDRLSAELRKDIQALADQRLTRERITALAARIEAERPDVVAAARDVLRPDGRVRVIFLVAPIGDDLGLASNINARYTVERVEIAGVDETRISQKLRDELQTLVGGRLDPVNAERLGRELEAELPDYEVTRRISRGTATGSILVVFDFAPAEARHWIPFSPSRGKIVYHEDQGWSGVYDIRVNTFGSHLFSVGFVRGNNDDLIEEYSGYWLRAENRHAGTRRLGMSIEFSKFTQDWNVATLSALASTPGVAPAYGRRRTVQPAVTFAFSPHVRVTAGASASELEPFSGAGVSQHANAAVAALDYRQSWKPESGGRQAVLAGLEWRAGTTALGSDLTYTRQFARAHYFFEQHHSRVRASLLVGRLTGGPAPMFERFSLGDSLTLRGWDKYAFAPIGGNRMWHQSIEYSYRGFGYFIDAGSIWDAGSDARVRLSTGVGYALKSGFMTFAVPLNADDVGVKFMVGIRFAGFGFARR